MKPIGTLKFSSQCQKACTYIENDMSAPAMYDYALQLKGFAFNIIAEAQKKEEEDKIKREKKDDSLPA